MVQAKAGLAESTTGNGARTVLGVVVTSEANVPTVADLQARCEKLYGPGKWTVLKTRHRLANIVDDALTPEQRLQLKTAMDTAESRAKKQAS